MNKNHLQKRTKFRANEDSGDRYIEGYFVVFDEIYDMGDGLSESVDRHAFDKTLGGDIRVLINHNTEMVLGRTKAGTATLTVDDHGLFGRVKVNPDDTDAMNAWARVQRGDVDQASFGFRIVSEEMTRKEDSVHWTLTEVELYEISVCTFPAYEGTSLSARSEEQEHIKARKFEAWRERQKERIETWH